MLSQATVFVLEFRTGLSYHLAVEYEIEYERRAFKSLGRIDRVDQQRIVDRISALAVDPRPHRATKLAGLGDAWRVRQGNHRIIYTIDDAEHVVTITKIG